LGQDSAGFTVQAQIPSNQVDKEQTYFDLRVEPGQAQTLQVVVNNTSSEAIVVDVSAISASTNSNGVIDYTTPGVKDETLRHPFAEMSMVNTPVLQLQPHQSAVAEIEVTVPAEQYEGTVLGGLVFRRRPAAETDTQTVTSQAGDMDITNVYSYILAVKLTETEVAVQPNFELVKVEPGQVNSYAEITHNIRNTQAAIAKNLTLKFRVFSQDEQKDVISKVVGNVDMAPNSVMPYGLRWPNSQAKPGRYTS